MKSIFNIISEEETDPDKTVLLMTVGETFFSYALFNLLSSEICEYGYYTLTDSSKDTWRTLFEESEKFSKKYVQTVVAYSLEESVLIPEEYYKIDKSDAQLEVIYGDKFHTLVKAEQVSNFKMYNQYRISTSLYSIIEKKFPSCKFLNCKTIQLNNIFGDQNNSICIDFGANEFSTLVFKKNKLQLSNTFSYTSPEDVLYFILKICQHSGLSQQDVKIILSGLIEKDSAIFRELYKYFIHLDFEAPHPQIKISSALNEYPIHYYSTISKLVTCVL